MNGFEITDEELELARKIASTVAETYGDFTALELEDIRQGGIWNDHCSVQTAILCIKVFKGAHQKFVEHLTKELLK